MEKKIFGSRCPIEMNSSGRKEAADRESFNVVTETIVCNQNCSHFTFFMEEGSFIDLNSQSVTPNENKNEGKSYFSSFLTGYRSVSRPI